MQQVVKERLTLSGSLSGLELQRQAYGFPDFFAMRAVINEQQLLLTRSSLFAIQSDPQKVCITRAEYLRSFKGWQLKDLSSGNYTLKVRASSLAGWGNYSALASFQVEDRRKCSFPFCLCRLVYFYLD